MVDHKEETVAHLDGAEISDLKADQQNAVVDTSDAAAVFETYQHSLTIGQAIRQNIKPLAWCTYMFFLCITFGYDGMASSVVVSIPWFRKDFGTPYEGDYVVDAAWQLGWQGATLGGIVLGGFMAGLAVNLWGRQLSILGGQLLSVAGIFLQYFASTNAMFFGGKLLTGIPLGVFTTIAPTYASEMSPLKIRGAIAAGTNFAIVLGQLIGYGVMRQSGFYNDARQYKVMFATEWGFAAIGIIVLPFFVESPYWLVSHGKEEKARANLVKLHRPDYDVDGHMAEIKAALARLAEDSAQQGSIRECFSQKQWRRTLVGTSMYFIQNCCGSVWVIGYMSYFMQLGGLSSNDAFSASVGVSGLMVIGNMFGWLWVEKFGRRATALWGAGILCITLFLIGILAVIKTHGAIWGQVAFMAVWGFVYQGTIGSAAWPIAAENATSRLRSPTMALCTMMTGLSSCIWSFSLPYAINADEGNMGGKIAFVFAGTLVFATLFIFFMVPETKGRTYIEIDELWERRISPRKFATTQILTVVNTDKDTTDKA